MSEFWLQCDLLVFRFQSVTNFVPNVWNLSVMWPSSIVFSKCYQFFPVQNLSRLPEEKLELTVITSTDFWQQNSYQIVLKSNNFQSHHLRLERIARESRWSLARPSTSSHCDVRRLNLEDLFSVFHCVSKFHHTSSPSFGQCLSMSYMSGYIMFIYVHICQISYQLT